MIVYSAYIFPTILAILGLCASIVPPKTVKSLSLKFLDNRNKIADEFQKVIDQWNKIVGQILTHDYVYGKVFVGFLVISFIVFSFAEANFWGGGTDTTDGSIKAVGIVFFSLLLTRIIGAYKIGIGYIGTAILFILIFQLFNSLFFYARLFIFIALFFIVFWIQSWTF